MGTKEIGNTVFKGTMVTECDKCNGELRETFLTCTMVSGTKPFKNAPNQHRTDEIK